MKATVDGIVFEVDTAQDLGIALASYKNSVFKQATQVVSDATQNTSSSI